MIDAQGDPLTLPLIGEIDAIVDSPDGPVIVDWKTASRKWPESKVRLDLQPTCYLYAVKDVGGKPVSRFRFEVITKTKTPAVDIQDTVRHEDHFQRLVETVKVLEKIVKAEAFLPNDQGWACGDCPYSLTCQSWHRCRGQSMYNLELAA